jgi:hypothetical protein
MSSRLVVLVLLVVVVVQLLVEPTMTQSALI